ncbi:MAG: FtsX-like permease family protein [Candidatus Saccharimonadales bacterium]
MKKNNSHNYSTIKPTILISIAYNNIVYKKLRTILTVIGIAIGIGSIYFLLSFGLGLQQLVTNRVIGDQSIRTIEVVPTNSQILRLDDVSVNRIKEISNISDTGSAYYFPGSFKISNSESDGIVYGIDKGYEELTYLNLIEGTKISETKETKPVIINTSALKSIGISEEPNKMIGKTVDIVVPLAKPDNPSYTYKETFTVVGIIDSGSGAEVFIPSEIFKDQGIPNLTQLKVGAQDVDSVPTIRAQIESLGFDTKSPVDTLNEINKVFHILNIVLVGFGGIGMIIAILGMFNTLTISLLERTREIGLMIALGGRPIDMRKIFIFEALILSIFGSLIGVIGAIILSWLVNLILNILASQRGVEQSFSVFSNNPFLIIGVMLFMILVGLSVVILPAIRAQKINPIDALRRE